MSKNFTITTIITSLNSGATLECAINSFLAQDYEYKQLIIVDGKSTDDSHKIIAEFIKNNSNIEWIQELDDNMNHARNIGIHHATGDIIGFLGGDDQLADGIFSKIAKHNAVYQNYDAIYFNSYTLSDNVATFSNSASVNFTKRNLLKFPPIVVGEAIYYKKNVFTADQNYFNEKNLYTGDFEFNLSLLSSKKKYVFYPLNETGVYWITVGSQNLSSLYRDKQRHETIALMFKYCTKFSEYQRVIGYNFKKLLKFNVKILQAYRRLT